MKILITIKLLLTFMLSAFFLFFMNSHVVAEENTLWKSVGSKKAIVKEYLAENEFSGNKTELKVRRLEFDEISFQLLANELNSSNFAAKNSKDESPQLISLPLPNGTEISVKIKPSVVMSNNLAAQFPNIKTWEVSGTDKNVRGSIEFGPRGLHGMLIMPDGDKIFIEPEEINSNLNKTELTGQSPYVSFSKKENSQNFQSEFSCGTHEKHSDLSFAARGNSRLLARPSSDLITYRLAVATTGEYSQFHGGTVESTLSAIVSTINRVNQIYRRDLSIQFELVDEQRDLIYLNPNTDPYTNSDVFALIQENDENLSANGVLSKTQYDVGHVFGQGGVGGLALVGGVCDNDEKALGATGISNPFGDAFALDYVAHELGHQLGGTHTFNSACNGGGERTGITAVEPGSGTTIMAYPGICQANNIQNSVDSQFHIVSIDQIRSVTRTGSGSSCGVRTSTTNENPTVNAGVDMNIPARTPIVLIANGADTDNDNLTYSWEQSDTGVVTDVNVDSGDNALFRSRPLTANNIRYIPTLNNLFVGTAALGEVLPVTNREINMVATVRDGNGGLQADLIKFNVSDSGQSFAVTSHTSNQSFGREETTEVRWNVAGTNVSPVSCANVDIGLVTVDGQGLDITTTANDGRETITIPANAQPMNNARFIVSCNTSNFFNVSNGGITILDQVGGGSNTNSGGGGGSFGSSLIAWFVLLIGIKKYRFSGLRQVNTYRKHFKISFLFIPLLFSVQACSTPVPASSSNSKTDSAMPKEFGSRFSSEKIKQERESYYSQKLMQLKSLNAGYEVSKAVQSKNIYLISTIAGRGTTASIPGLVGPQTQILNCKIVASEGMGDVLYGKNHLKYRQEMLRYMREFNALMQPYCK